MVVQITHYMDICWIGQLLALDEDLDALETIDGVVEPLEMVIMHKKVWHPHKW